MSDVNDSDIRNQIYNLINRFRSEPNFISEQIAVQLSELGTIPVIPLIQALKDEDSGVRYFASLALEYIGDPRAIEPLNELLNDDNDEVRLGAADVLTKFTNLSIVRYIKSLKDKDWKIRSTAAYILGKIVNEGSVEPLIEASTDAHDYVRYCVINALGNYSGEKILTTLIQATKDEDKNVRWIAVESLGKFTNKEVLLILKKLEVSDADIEVRKNASKIIKQLDK